MQDAHIPFASCARLVSHLRCCLSSYSSKSTICHSERQRQKRCIPSRSSDYAVRCVRDSHNDYNYYYYNYKYHDCNNNYYYYYDDRQVHMGPGCDKS